MIIKVQISIIPGDGVAEIVEEVARIEREQFSPAELGLNLCEAKSILSGSTAQYGHATSGGVCGQRVMLSAVRQRTPPQRPA